MDAIILMAIAAIALKGENRPQNVRSSKDIKMHEVGDDPYRPSYEIKYARKPPTKIERVILFFKSMMIDILKIWKR